jgi:WD40-like Beta Propeller Repeat
MKRIALLAVALLALAPAIAQATFPGRNGPVAYGWSASDEPDIGPFRYVRAIRLVDPQSRAVTSGTGCDHTVDPDVTHPADDGCLSATYADPAFSRTGRFLAFDNGRSLALFDPEVGELRILPATSEDDGEPAFSAAGGRIAFSAGFPPSGSGGDGRSIWIRDLVHDATELAIRGGVDPAWSSRNWIAYVSPDAEQIWMARPGGRHARRLATGAAPAWSPHGTKLAYVSRSSIRILDLATRRSRVVLRGEDAVDLAWSPDGRLLAYTSFDGGLSIVRTDGRGARELVGGGVGGTYDYQAVGVDWQPLPH